MFVDIETPLNGFVWGVGENIQEHLVQQFYETMALLYIAIAM